MVKRVNPDGKLLCLNCWSKESDRERLLKGKDW